MYRIKLSALALAFLAELGVDILWRAIVINLLAGDQITADMGEDAARQVLEAVSQTPTYLMIGFVLGNVTTVGGGYLAARLSRQYPYYHGLGMGLLGIAFTLYLWREQTLWLGLFSILANIPLCIWGAHLAKRHMPPPEE
jgi:hypothetical protein